MQDFGDEVRFVAEKKRLVRDKSVSKKRGDKNVKMEDERKERTAVETAAGRRDLAGSL